jgi:hypothetical protein
MHWRALHLPPLPETGHHVNHPQTVGQAAYTKLLGNDHRPKYFFLPYVVISVHACDDRWRIEASPGEVEIIECRLLGHPFSAGNDFSALPILNHPFDPREMFTGDDGSH